MALQPRSYKDEAIGKKEDSVSSYKFARPLATQDFLLLGTLMPSFGRLYGALFKIIRSIYNKKLFVSFSVLIQALMVSLSLPVDITRFLRKHSA